jgi:hypothetical protein
VSYVRCGTRYGCVYGVEGVQNVVDGVALATEAVASTAATVIALRHLFMAFSSSGAQLRLVGTNHLQRACRPRD